MYELYYNSDSDSSTSVFSNGLVIQTKNNRTGNTWTPDSNIIDSSGMIGAAGAAYGSAYAGERTLYVGTEWNGTSFISHSKSNGTGASGTLYGAILLHRITESQIQSQLSRPGYSFNSFISIIKY